MKRSELFFISSFIPSDIIAIIAAFTLAYYTRVQFDVIYIWTFVDYLRFLLILIPFWILIFSVGNLYKIKNLHKGALDDIAPIFNSISAGIMLVVAYIFLSKIEFFSRLIVIYAWGYSFVIVYLLRQIIKAIRRYLMKFGVGVYRVMIIGSPSASEEIISTINQKIFLGYKIVKIIDRSGIEKIEVIIKRNPIDTIFVADPNITDPQIMELIERTEDYNIDVKLVPNIIKLKEANLSTETIYGIPIINLHKTPLDGWGAIIKRIIDIIASIVAMVVLSPVMIVLALIIKLTSKGPVIYKNIRVGHNGDFKTYKFRTMSSDYCTGDEYGGETAEKFEDKLIKEKNIKKGSAVYKIADDPRITPIGRFLRKTSLDELPQFYNVLKGNMSLVGPRPHQPKEVVNYTKKQRKLLIIKPGITGLAQISGRSDLSFEDEAKLDIFYLENWSPWLDVKIVIRTFGVVLHPKGAY